MRKSVLVFLLASAVIVGVFQLRASTARGEGGNDYCCTCDNGIKGTIHSGNLSAAKLQCIATCAAMSSTNKSTTEGTC